MSNPLALHPRRAASQRKIKKAIAVASYLLSSIAVVLPKQERLLMARRCHKVMQKTDQKTGRIVEGSKREDRNENARSCESSEVW